MKEERRKRLSLFSGVVKRRTPGFGGAGAGGAPGRKASRGAFVHGRQPGGGEQCIVVGVGPEDDCVVPPSDVPIGNLRRVIHSPRKNKCSGRVKSDMVSSEVTTEHNLPKFNPTNPPSRIPDFNMSQACISRHPELRPATQVRENHYNYIQPQTQTKNNTFSERERIFLGKSEAGRSAPTAAAESVPRE